MAAFEAIEPLPFPKMLRSPPPCYHHESSFPITMYLDLTSNHNHWSYYHETRIKTQQILVGPPRFELELLTPQARRIPSYPTGPHINSLLDTPNAQWYLYFTQSDFIELQHLDDENPCIESINTTIQTEITSIVHSCMLLSSYLTENMSKIRTTERERWSR